MWPKDTNNRRVYLFKLNCFVISQPSLFNNEKQTMHKAMSSGDLGKTDSLRKISQGDGRLESDLLLFFPQTVGFFFRLQVTSPTFPKNIRVRGKMRFWGKTKQGEKKSSRDRLMHAGESLDGDYPDTALLMAEGEMMVT